MIDVTPVSERPQRNEPAPRATAPAASEEPPQQEATQPAEDDRPQPEETQEPSPADAYELGYQARDANRPRRAPPEVANMGESFANAWIGGWEARDNELVEAAKKR